MKMLSRILAIAILTTLVIIFGVGCNKYEDGPALSFRSKTQRVANTWVIDKAYDDGKDVTGDYDQYELQLLTNKSAKLVTIYRYNNVQFEFETNGTWSLVDDKENLKLDFEDDDADQTYEILKLEEKEMWLRKLGDDAELHLKPR